MSWKASGYVKGLNEGMTRSEKLLMLILSDYYDESLGYAWPTVARLAAEAMLTENHVYKLLASLKSKGLLEVESGRATRSSNRYSFPGHGDRPLKMRPLTDDRSDLSSPPVVAVIEPSAEEEDAKSRAEEWDDLCEWLGVRSGVDHLRYWEHVTKVPDLLISSERLIRELVKYNTSMRLVPGSLGRIGVAAEILAPLDLSDNAFKAALAELPISSPEALQNLAKNAAEWAIGIYNDYGKVSFS